MCPCDPSQLLVVWISMTMVWECGLGGIGWECDLVFHLTTVSMAVGCHSMGLWVGLAGKVTLSTIGVNGYLWYEAVARRQDCTPAGFTIATHNG